MPPSGRDGSHAPRGFWRLPGRAVFIVLAILMVAGELGLVLLPAIAREPAYDAEVISETRLRAEPRRKGKPLVRLPAGTRVTVRGKPEDGWYRARRGPIEGFILSGAVATAPLPPGSNAQPGEAIDDPGVVEEAQRAGDRKHRGKGNQGDKREKGGKDERKAQRKRDHKDQRKQDRKRDRERGGDRRDDSGVITSTVLNLRVDPEQEARVLEAIPRGERVEPTGEHQDGWVQLRWKGHTGWALGRYLAAPRAVVVRQDGDDSSWSRNELKAIIFAAADRYGQPREDMLRVARCESNMIPAAVNADGGSYGLFQFKPGTWLSTPFAKYDIFDPRASANAAAWMWSEGRRREWVCQ